MRLLLVIGGGSTALEIRECADLFYKDLFEKVYNVIGDNEKSTLSNIIHDSEVDSFIANNNEVAFIIGFTNQKLRKLFNEKLHACEPVSFVHPTAFISPSATIGEGSYVGATAVVSSNTRVGKGCIVNIGVSVGHDAVVGDDCIFNPGARISGHCQIGSRTLFGANSFIFQGRTVGEDCAIDALTYIDRDIEDKKLCTSNVGGMKVFKNRIF